MYYIYTRKTLVVDSSRTFIWDCGFVFCCPESPVTTAVEDLGSPDPPGSLDESCVPVVVVDT